MTGGICTASSASEMTIGGPRAAPGALDGEVRSESVWPPRARRMRGREAALGVRDVVCGDAVDDEVARELAADGTATAPRLLGLRVGERSLPNGARSKPARPRPGDHRGLLARDDDVVDLHLSAEERAVDRVVALDGRVLEHASLSKGCIDGRAAVPSSR